MPPQRTKDRLHHLQSLFWCMSSVVGVCLSYLYYVGLNTCCCIFSTHAQSAACHMHRTVLSTTCHTVAALLPARFQESNLAVTCAVQPSCSWACSSWSPGWDVQRCCHNMAYTALALARASDATSKCNALCF
ncbi:hypothetical protein COO60DRAFT_1294288, partial [Scenedesmus sp. NREL 46B-D3]